MNSPHRPPPPFRSNARGGLLAIAALLAAGCDLTEPTASFPVQPGAPVLAEVEHPVPLGSSGISLPGTNGWSETHATHWQPTGLTIGAGQWVHVVVSGGVSYSLNGDCYYASFPCSTPLHGSTTGPLFSGGASRIIVTFAPAGGPPLTGTEWQPHYTLHPVDGDDQTAMAAYTLRRPNDARTIWVRREITFGGSWNPILGTTDGFQYYLGGSQTVSATFVPKPLRVTSPQTVAPAGTGVWKAEIVGPFKARRPEGVGPGYYPNIYWLFYPNDTIPDRPAPPGAFRYVGECNDRWECEYAPPGPGRMEAVASVEGQPVTDRGGIVRVQENTLELTCPTSVTRGQPMTCKVAAKPSGTLTEVRWIFRDTVGYEVPSPSDLLEWNGVLVIGGEMRVSALLNGDSVSASRAIAVLPRTWSRLRIRVQEENPNHLPPPAAVSFAGELADIHADSIGPLPVRTIDTGPNTGWSYLHSELPRIPITVLINEPAFAPGSDWRKLQTGGTYTHPNGTVVPNGYCTSAHVPTIRQLAREHEGSLSSALTSHAEVFQRYLQNNPVHEVMEKRIVHRSELASTAEEWFYGSYVTDVAAPLENDPNQAHKNHSPPGLVDLAPFPCYPRPWY